MLDVNSASEISSTPPFDPSLYPRTYRSSPGYRAFLLLVAGLLGAGALLGMIYFGAGHEMKSLGERAVFVVISFVLFLLALYIVFYTFKSKLKYHGSSCVPARKQPLT
jgi:poly-D-alanine transfer protein DltD